MAAKDVMRQSLFDVPQQIERRSEARLHTVVIAIYLAAGALVVALTALTIVLLR